MSEKPMTVTEMARMGGLARAKAYGKAQLRTWGKQGGRPTVLDGKAHTLLVKMLRDGKTHPECAAVLGVSLRTIGRFVSRKATAEA